MDGLMARKKAIMMMGRGIILPPEYQAVEYIESTGTQFIQLPYGFDDTDVITITASIDTDYGTDKFILCPMTWNNNQNRFAIVGVFSKYYCVGYGSSSTGNTKLVPNTENDGDVHTWTYSDHLFKIPKLGLERSVSNLQFGGTTTNLKLFYGYNVLTKGKVSYYKHKKANGNTYELIPCFRISDDVIGMYDRINNVFYTNDGTGTFLKGADI